MIKILCSQFWTQCRLFIGVALWMGIGSLHAEEFLSEEDLFEENTSEMFTVYDPLEPLNRAIFRVNDRVYTYLVDPVSDFYHRVTPERVRAGILNFFDNLKFPVRLSANLLQGRFANASLESERFLLNTTVGLFGILNPADTMARYDALSKEDLGQALAQWGLPRGPYLVLPIWGPSTVRDFCGLIGDRAVNPTQRPFSAIDHWDWQDQAALSGAEVIARFGDRYQKMKAAQIDAYSAFKLGYIQYREATIRE
ncbi:MAG: MlaA family lipoprotein [Opitutales bacterium]